MITPTFLPSDGGAYSGPGGPWDVGPLDSLTDDGDASAVAVVDGDRRLTLDYLTTLAGWIASLLADRGVAPGDPVSFQLPNRHEALAVYLGCWRAGAAFQSARS